MFKIDLNDYKNLILWASIYSTWGWIPFDVQINKWPKLFLKTNKINILELKDFKEDDFICNIYWVWSAGDNSFEVKAQFEKWFKYLKEKFSYNISWIFEAETNIESILFEMSLALDFSIFDADCTWWRAVPELIYDNFVVEKRSFLPLVAIDKDLNIYTITEEKPVKEIEDFLRNLYTKTWWSVAVIDHIISIKEAKSLLTLWVLKRDLELWKFISNWRNFNQILSIIWWKLIWEWIITEINFENNWWFLKWNYKVKLTSGEEMKAEVKNENMVLLNDLWEKIIDFPDFIITVYKDSFIWIHNSSLKVWDNIILIKKEAETRRKEKYKKDGN